VASYDYIEANLIKLKKNIDRVCRSVERDAKEIHIVAVSKTFPAAAVASALDFNQLDFGENRVQELIVKQKEIQGRIINWHLVGHLQTNKVKYIVPFIYLIHSLDSLKLALKIQTEAAKLGKVVNCLIQVNSSGEEQKSGCEIKEALKLVKEISIFDNVRIKGLMTIARLIPENAGENERNAVRENFRALRELFNEIKVLCIPNVEMKYLSMGMTADYEIAIEEGSNMLRIGTAIFGERVEAAISY
jgi:pyridoxal phosphate enzyme (YggS family)